MAHPQYPHVSSPLKANHRVLAFGLPHLWNCAWTSSNSFSDTIGSCIPRKLVPFQTNRPVYIGFLRILSILLQLQYLFELEKEIQKTEDYCPSRPSHIPMLRDWTIWPIYGKQRN